MFHVPIIVLLHPKILTCRILVSSIFFTSALMGNRRCGPWSPGHWPVWYVNWCYSMSILSNMSLAVMPGNTHHSPGLTTAEVLHVSE